MPYVMPPNNAIRILCDQNSPDEPRRLLFEQGIQIELDDMRNTPGGGGPVRGWGAGRGRR